MDGAVFVEAQGLQGAAGQQSSRPSVDGPAAKLGRQCVARTSNTRGATRAACAKKWSTLWRQPMQEA